MVLPALQQPCQWQLSAGMPFIPLIGLVLRSAASMSAQAAPDLPALRSNGSTEWLVRDEPLAEEASAGLAWEDWWWHALASGSEESKDVLGGLSQQDTWREYWAEFGEQAIAEAGRLKGHWSARERVRVTGELGGVPERMAGKDVVQGCSRSDRHCHRASVAIFPFANPCWYVHGELLIVDDDARESDGYHRRLAAHLARLWDLS